MASFTVFIGRCLAICQLLRFNCNPNLVYNEVKSKSLFMETAKRVR
jgi:hypothetical protein